MGLEQADVMVHSGDVTKMGDWEDAKDFIEWFCGLEYRYKIFIGENHDFCLEERGKRKIQAMLGDGCFYLQHSGVEIEGVRFWGVPMFLQGIDIEHYAEIPKKTDVLITHRPPMGILDFAKDMNFGCEDLLERVMEIRSKYHLFGHVHGGSGKVVKKKITFVNGSVVDENY